MRRRARKSPRGRRPVIVCIVRLAVNFIIIIIIIIISLVRTNVRFSHRPHLPSGQQSDGERQDLQRRHGRNQSRGRRI